ncbi:MAG: DNA polymerase/3'-5' exonuclease PolX [Haloferacaceae archaeon]
MSRNGEVAARLEEFADLLAVKGVEYKPRSYRRAAENVRDRPEPIEDLVAEGPDAVARIDGVGDAIAAKIVEYVETGSIAELDDLREELPVDVEALTAVEGVGPKTVGALYDALDVRTLDDLERAAREEEIREVSGFGPKTEANVLENVAFARRASERERLGDVRPLADDLLASLADVPAVERAEAAGSLRRWKETVGDVDVLVATADPDAVIAALVDWERVGSVIEAGETKASVRVDGLRVDLRATATDEFGAALQYFTGSWDHNVALRNRAIDRGLKMNEYGVFDLPDVADPDGERAGERIAGETEAGMYAALDLPPIPPELREDSGEIEAAAAGDLPDLVTTDDLRGDLHTHTEWSDGDATIAEMVEAAQRRGYDYHVVSDHATGPGMVGGVGLTDDDLREQMGEIERVAADAAIPVLAGVEANVDADGDLSVGDDVLAALDVVVASPHSALGQDREAATDRLVRAVEHPETTVLGHPTGRLINSRPGLTPDVERVAAAAADHGVALEVNAHPHRLDLRDVAVRTAVEAGATLAVNTDAHVPAELDNARYGVHTARRGWAEATDVLNAREVDGLREFL